MTGKRILVIEDEFLIALEIQSQLQTAGFADVVHAATEKAALLRIQEGGWDTAVADANLNGRGLGRVAAALLERYIPFVIVTGYSRDSLPAEVVHIPLIEKPLTGPSLVREVTRLCAIGRALNSLRSDKSFHFGISRNSVRGNRSCVLRKGLASES